MLDGDRLTLFEDAADGFADVVIFHICVCVFVVSLERLSLLIVYILKDKSGKDNRNF
jgi:hypothetical protein